MRVDTKEIARRYSAGLSKAQVARELGVGPTVVLKALRLEGVARRTTSAGRRLQVARALDLTSVALDTLDGLLLGDGCISGTAGQSIYQHTDKHRSAIQYLAELFRSFGCETWESAEQHIELLGKHYTAWKFNTRAYGALYEQRVRWYPNGAKVAPPDLRITPIGLLWWFIGDGTLHGNSPALCIHDMRADARRLQELLADTVGVRVAQHYGGKVLSISARDRGRFYNFMPPCPLPAYEYKWAANTHV